MFCEWTLIGQWRMHWGLGGLAYIQSCFPLPFWDGASVTHSLLPGALGSSQPPPPCSHPTTTPSILPSWWLGRFGWGMRRTVSLSLARAWVWLQEGWVCVRIMWYLWAKQEGSHPQTYVTVPWFIQQVTWQGPLPRRISRYLVPPDAEVVISW